MNLNLDRSTWKRVKLGDVVLRSRTQVDPFDGGVDRYVAGGHIDTDSVIISRSGNVTDGQMGSTFRYVFRPGQVLFVSARPYLRKTGVPDFGGVVADKTYVLEATPDNGLLHDMLPFLLTSDRFVEYANQEATGSMNPRLLWGAMQRYEFQLPSLDEQKRMSDLLWAIERHHQTLPRLKASLAAAASQFFSSQLSIGPDDIGKYADVLVGFAFASNCFTSVASVQSRPLLRGINIGVGATRWEDSDTVHWAEALTDRMMKYVLIGGDVVIPMDRPFTADGQLRWAELNSAEEGALLVQRVARLRPRDPAYSPLIRAIVRSSPFQAALNGSLTGSFAPHLAHSDFTRYKFTAPSPEIASRQVAKAELAQVSIDREWTHLNSIRSSVLADVFGSS